MSGAKVDDDFDLRYDAEPAMPTECDWGWCKGEAVDYREEGDDSLPVCQAHLDHSPDLATMTCREDGSPWPCGVERYARRSLAEALIDAKLIRWREPELDEGS